jgi:hypothetical protein
MKWIGQHIYDLVAKFRSDVYLENISSGTIASGGNLGLDSNNKIVKQSDTGITDLHGAGVDGSANQLLTDDGDGTVTSEANLTFDGSTLSIEADSNTTADALTIDMNSSTTGSAIFIDVDDALTATATKSLAHIDYDKAGVVGDGQSLIVYGLDINMHDAATNHANSSIVQEGIHISIDASNNQGTIYQTGINLKLTDGDVANTIGVYSWVENGGLDFKAVSSADAGDYFTIATTTHGATTLTTVDDDAAAAHFEIAADGNITLDPAGVIELEGNTTVTGDFTVNGDNITFESANADDPAVIIKNTANDNQAARFRMLKLRTDTALNNDRVGEVDFVGEDDGGTQTQYGKIMVQALEVDDGDERGKMSFQVAEYDGANTTGLSISGHTADGVINVDVGAGATSVTTIAGTLTMGSTAAMTNAGLLSVANQSNITGLGTITSGVWNGTAIASAYMASATDSAKGAVELATTGEADTGTDTARAVTPAGLKSHVDARYSYQYLHFSFKANNVAPDLWRSPNQVGVEYYEWDNNHGVSGTTQAASDAPKDVDINTTISVDYLDQTTGFIIPKACKLDGFYGNCRVNGTNPNTLRPVLGLFRAAEPADGNTSDLTATCVAFDKYDTASGNRKNRFLKLETQGLDTDLAQGDILFPATGFDATASDSAGDIWGAFTIVLKTLIP